MIDLSPEPREKSSGTAELHPAPRHDSLPLEKSARQTAGWQFPYDRAEAAIQLLSRWAGPAVLVAVLGAIGWALFG